jgi:outer membrane murein-binding lipoprotein Lpp
MDADLTALEQKLLQLIARYNELRDENARLRIDLGAMESDTALLKANMARASERIEALMQTLP